LDVDKARLGYSTLLYFFLEGLFFLFFAKAQEEALRS
jgi:hypothetical protein